MARKHRRIKNRKRQINDRLNTQIEVEQDFSGTAPWSQHEVDPETFSQLVEGSHAVRKTRDSLDRLRKICESLQELADRASKESCSMAERVALQARADVLAAEYNRIVASTDFNVTEKLGAVLDELKIYLH